MSFTFGNIAGHRDSGTTELADKTKLFMRRESVSGIVDGRYQFHSLLPSDQILVTTLRHILGPSGLRTRDSGLLMAAIPAAAASRTHMPSAIRPSTAALCSARIHHPTSCSAHSGFSRRHHSALPFRPTPSWFEI